MSPKACQRPRFDSKVRFGLTISSHEDEDHMDDGEFDRAPLSNMIRELPCRDVEGGGRTDGHGRCSEEDEFQDATDGNSDVLEDAEGAFATGAAATAPSFGVVRVDDEVNKSREIVGEGRSGCGDAFLSESWELVDDIPLVSNRGITED
jgi:hypothetical protein